VRLQRLHKGEWTALTGAVALAVLLGFDWFFLSTPDARIGAHESGIRALGWFPALLLVAAIGFALAMVFATATQRAQAWPIVLCSMTFVFGALAALAIVVRLIAQPGLGVGAGNADVEIEPGALLGLVAAIAISAGGWMSQVDERTDTAEAREQTEEVLSRRPVVSL
jgi:hypothetical protein